MANLAEQLSTITAGESISLTLSYADYPRSAGWALSVAICGDGFTDSATCTAGTGADEFLLTVPYGDTEDWKNGNTAFVCWATKGAVRKQAEQGVFRVFSNPSLPSYNQTVLTAIRALISGRATDDQRTTSLEGIALQYMSPVDLLKWELIFSSRVAAEVRAQSGGKLRQSISYILPV